jgi:hypothetical protein
MGWVGLAGIVAAFSVIDPAAGGFPAPWAVLPVAATALVLAGGVGGDDTLVWTGAGNATLTRNVFTASTALKATFTDVGFATITGDSAANIFTINGYGGVANISGGATATDTLNVITSATVVALADTSLSLNGTVSTLAGVESVNFTGSAASQNFDVSGWNATDASTITGGGGVDQLVDSATSATIFTLSAATYRKASLATWTLAKVGVSLTGSTADDNFVIDSFTAGKISVNGNGGANETIGGAGGSGCCWSCGLCWGRSSRGWRGRCSCSCS